MSDNRITFRATDQDQLNLDQIKAEYDLTGDSAAIRKALELATCQTETATSVTAAPQANAQEITYDDLPISMYRNESINALGLYRHPNGFVFMRIKNSSGLPMWKRVD
jgi:hypothetical protein